MNVSQKISFCNKTLDDLNKHMEKIESRAKVVFEAGGIIYKDAEVERLGAKMLPHYIKMAMVYWELERAEKELTPAQTVRWHRVKVKYAALVRKGEEISDNGMRLKARLKRKNSRPQNACPTKRKIK